MSWSRSRSRSELGWGWDLRFLRTKKPARVAERNIRISLSGHISRQRDKEMSTDWKCVCVTELCSEVFLLDFFWNERNGEREKVRREGGCSWSLVKFGCSSIHLVYSCATHTTSLSISMSAIHPLFFFCPLPPSSFFLGWNRILIYGVDSDDSSLLSD